MNYLKLKINMIQQKDFLFFERHLTRYGPTIKLRLTLEKVVFHGIITTCTCTVLS